MAFCANCGAQLTAGANNCSACGRPAGQSAGGGAAAAPAQSASAVPGGMPDNLVGLLAYITIIPAIIFLVVPPYNQSRFVRFHCFQCIFLCVALIAVSIVLGFIPIIGWIISPFVGLGGLIVAIIAALKAYGNQTWKIPVIGDFAEKQANA